VELPTGLEQLLGILLKPRSIPIAGMLLLVIFIGRIGLKQVRRSIKR
jgi:hypothetical protein